MGVEGIRDWLLADPASRVPLALAALGILFVLPLLGFSVYLWRMAALVITSREFPPRGYALVRTTQMITGDAAVAYGRGLRALVFILVALAFLVVIQLWRLGSVITR